MDFGEAKVRVQTLLQALHPFDITALRHNFLVLIICSFV